MLQFLRSRRFTLSESTRRFLVRGLFLIAAVLPTFATISWTCWIRSSYHRQRCIEQWQQHLSHRFGYRVKITAADQLSPTAFNLYGIEAFDPETRARIASCQLLVIRRIDDRWELAMNQLELSTDELRSGWRLIHDSFLCKPSNTHERTGVFVKSVKFSGLGMPAVNQLRLEVNAHPDRLHAKLIGMIDQATTPFEINIHRTHFSSTSAIEMDQRFVTTRPRSTRILFNTNQAEFACRNLQKIAPESLPLGNAATFQGQADWFVSDFWDSTFSLTGTFNHVDLASLFPNQVSGQAKLTLLHCVLEDHRVVHANGQITGAQGALSSSLLFDLSRLFDQSQSTSSSLKPFSNDLGNTPFTSFTHLGYDFKVQNERISLTGRFNYEGKTTGLAHENSFHLYDSGENLPLLQFNSCFEGPSTQSTGVVAWLSGKNQRQNRSRNGLPSNSSASQATMAQENYRLR